MMQPAIAPTEFDVLYTALGKLTHATTPAEQLEAVSDYPLACGATRGVLFYIDPDESLRETVVAEWLLNDYPPMGVGSAFDGKRRKLAEYWRQIPDQPMFIEDRRTDPRVDAETLAFGEIYGLRSGAFLPLRNKGRWIGLIVFYWTEPQVFSGRDQRIYTAILQQAAPMIDSVRLAEQARTRARDLERVHSERDFLYSALGKLTQATTPEEQLEAISAYARGRGAVVGRLYYFAEFQPYELENVAEWTLDPASTLGVGTRITLGSDHDSWNWFTHPDRCTLFGDVLTAENLRESSRTMFMQHNLRAVAQLVLNINGRWVGIITFGWEDAFQFDARDERVFTALQQQAAPVIASSRLFTEQQERAARAEALVRINTALPQAKDELEILKVLVSYAETVGAHRVHLIYLEEDYANGSDDRYVRDVAIWTRAEGYRLPTTLPRKYVNLRVLDDGEHWRDDARALFSTPNLANETRLDPAGRDWLMNGLGAQALVALPLNYGGRNQGTATIFWDQPHEFSEEERYVYTSLLTTVSAIVATRRAYLAEQDAREENEMLYRVGKAINAVRTFSELMEAVAPLLPDADTVLLTIFENFDSENAAYFEIKGIYYRSGVVQRVPVGTRYTRNEFPIVTTFAHQPGILVIEDMANALHVDPVSRDNWLSMNIRALIGANIFIKQRYIGGVRFVFADPRQFTPRERRLVVGIGDLILAAIERIRLQAEQEQARFENEMLYRMGEAINAATTFDEIVAAVAPIDPQASAVGLALLEDIDGEPQPFFDMRAMLHRDEQVLLAAGMRFRLDDFPVGDDLPEQGVWGFSAIATDPHLDAVSRTNWLGIGVQALIATTLRTSLSLKSHRSEALAFFSAEPRLYTESEKRLIAGVGDLVLAAIERVRLRAEEAQARQESETLYRLGEAVNAASSYDELVAAVAMLDIPADVVTLSLHDGSDFPHAGYIDIVAALVRSAAPGAVAVRQGQRFPLEAFPVTRTLTQRGAWVVEDFQNDPDIDAATRANTLMVHLRANLGSILMTGSRVIGLVNFLSSVPRHYTEREKRLAAGAGDLVVAAVERVRLQSEQEAARREIEQLYRVGRAINAATTFDELLEAVASVDAEAQAVLLGLFQDYDYHSASYLEIPALVLRSPEIALVRGQRFPVGAFPVVDKLPVHGAWAIDNLDDDPRVDPVSSASWRALNVRAVRGAGISLNGRRSGGLVFLSMTPRECSERDQRLLEGIGDLVSAAVERIQLQNETTSARQRAELLANVNAALSQSTDEDAILSAIAPLLDYCAADLAVLTYRDGNTAEFVAARARHFGRIDPEGLPERHLTLDTFPHISRAAAGEQVIFIEDYATDPRVQHTATQAFVRLMGWQAAVGVPLKSADQWQGQLTFAYYQPHQFSPEVRRVFQALRPTAASVVNSRRAYLAEQAARTETERRARELAALEERTRLARELHDSVSQVLFGIGLGARTARTLLARDPQRVSEPLDYVLSLAEAGLTEMRALIFELRPESLEQEGLITVLNKQAASMQARHQLRVETQFCEEPALPLDVKESLYRIAREALHNTLKHAQASHVLLLLARDADESGYRLEIADNGRGFDPTQPFPGHLGLKSMRERITTLNGTLTIDSTPGTGTRITVTIPDPV